MFINHKRTQRSCGSVVIMFYWQKGVTSGLGNSASSPLKWRHNEHDGVSNDQPHDFLLNQFHSIQTQMKENIKAPRHWPLCGEFTGDRWILRTKVQLRGKCFHLMTPSWHRSSLITCLVRPPFARHDWTCGIVPRRTINVLKPIQNVSHFADDIFKLIFLYQNCCILIQISNDPVNNKPALVKMVKLLLKLAPQIVMEVTTYPCPNFYPVLTKLYVDALN